MASQSSEITDGGLTVTYHLRDDLKWSNGDPLTAEHFVYAFQRIADPATKSGSIYLITDCCMVENAEEISTGELPVSELGVSAPDKQTFVIDLEQPFFLYLFVIILCHVLRSMIACILLKVTLSMIAGTKFFCRNLSSPGTTRSGLLPFFSYCGLKIGADCGIIESIRSAVC